MTPLQAVEMWDRSDTVNRPSKAFITFNYHFPFSPVVISATYHMLSLRIARHLLQFPETLRNLSLSPKLTSLTLHRTMASSAMSKRLEGKTIVITGASSGIGKSTAMEFARTSPKNLKLVLTARRVDKLKEVAEHIKTEVGDGVKVLPVKLDISNPDEVRGFVGALPEEFREIDVLVNNAWVFFFPNPGSIVNNFVVEALSKAWRKRLR